MAMSFNFYLYKENTIINICFVGVADGVGGWRAYGIDPGEFSSYLMKTCERLVQMGQFKMSEPGDLLAKSYYELLEHKKPILGKLIFLLFICIHIYYGKVISHNI